MRSSLIRDLYDASFRESAGSLGCAWLDDGTRSSAPPASHQRVQVGDRLRARPPAAKVPPAPHPPPPSVVVAPEALLPDPGPFVRPRHRADSTWSAARFRQRQVAFYAPRIVIGLVGGALVALALLFGAEACGAPIHPKRIAAAVASKAIDRVVHR